MKPHGLLFGIVAACATQPRHPLYNADRSPACGNIGQAGRCEAAHPRALHAVFGATASVSVTTRLLLAPVAKEQPAVQMQRPRLAADDSVAVGNVMGKNGRRVASQPLLTATATLAIAPQRPRVTEDADIAAGNVMSKPLPTADDDPPVQIMARAKPDASARREPHGHDRARLDAQRPHVARGDSTETP